MDGNRLLALAGGAVLVALFLGFLAGGGPSGHEAVSSSGFDLSSVAPSARPSAPAEREPARYSPQPVVGDVAESPAVGIIGRPTPSASEPGAPAPAAPRAASSPADNRAHEARFLAEHRAELKAYHARMTDIALRWRKSHKVVADVDMAFAAMPRYMEVKKRFDRSGDPFSFARDALALPEVRAEVSKRLAEPAVWAAALGMVNETLKSAPPPKALYAEALDFLGREPEVAKHVEGFTDQATKQAPLIAQALPKDADLGALQRLVSDAGAATSKR